MDQVYQFKLGEKTPVLTVNPRTGNPGTLELHAIKAPGTKGQVYLFKGTLSKEECQAAIKAEGAAGFLIGANASAPAFVVYDGNQSSFTVFTEAEELIGYVRVSEYDKCSVCRDCLQL